MIQLTSDQTTIVKEILKPYLQKNDWAGVRKNIREYLGKEGAAQVMAFFAENGFPILHGLISIPKHMFYKTGITKITIPSNIKKIEDAAFADCSQLTSVTFEEGVEIISSYAFSGCGLRKVDLPDSVHTIEDKAFQANPLQQITIPDRVTELYSNIFEDCPNNLIIYANSRKELPPAFKLRVPQDEVDFYKKHLRTKEEE